jgi:site-specific recombinase XerC
LEEQGTRILESDRVNRYQKDRRAVVAGLQEAALSDEAVKEALRLTAQEIRNLHAIARGARKGRDKRNIATELAALKILLDATVEKPKQTVEGDVGVQVVVQTMKREYELPAGTSTAALPAKVDDAE